MSKGTAANFVGVGRLGRSLKTETHGQTIVTKGSVATTAGYGDKERTLWWDLIIFGERGERIAKATGKGAVLFINAELTYRDWETRDGQARRSIELTVGYSGDIQIVDKGSPDSEDDGPPRQQSRSQGDRSRNERPQPAPFDNDLDDDVPF